MNADIIISNLNAQHSFSDGKHKIQGCIITQTCKLVETRCIDQKACLANTFEIVFYIHAIDQTSTCDTGLTSYQVIIDAPKDALFYARVYDYTKKKCIEWIKFNFI